MIYRIARMIITNMNAAHFGTWDDKFMAVSKLSIIPATFIFGFARLTDWYIMNEWYMSGVLIVLAIDHLLGSYVHFFLKKDFSAKINLKGLFTKIVITVLGYIVFELLYTIITPVEFVSAYFRVVIQLMVMLYPGLSAMGNMSLISGGKFPPIGWLNRFKDFNNTGDLEHLRTKPKDDINNNYDNYGKEDQEFTEK